MLQTLSLLSVASSVFAAGNAWSSMTARNAPVPRHSGVAATLQTAGGDAAVVVHGG